jgi:hypothetical protein
MGSKLLEKDEVLIRVHHTAHGDYVVDEEGNMVSPEKYVTFKKLEAWVDESSAFWSNMIEGITRRYT